MYREDLQKNQGMLFVFEEEAERAFYMKNTLLPLDLLFIDAQKTIFNIHQNAKPNNVNSIPSKGKAMFVLELNAFEAKNQAIQPGMVLKLNPYE